MAPAVSIITVCKNALAHLELTAVSVLAQDCGDFEWIVIDGASSDGTVEYMRGFRDPRVRFISEPDAGIYDAMNKGLRIAIGDWVWFLNAGDVAYDPSVLSQVVEQGIEADVCFGEVMIRSEGGQQLGFRSEVTTHILPEKLTHDMFRSGMIVSHQAYIPRRGFVSPYNLRYRLAADFDWIIRIQTKKPKTIRIKPIATVMREGATQNHWIHSQWECFLIQSRCFGVGVSMINLLAKALRKLVNTWGWRTLR